jgi:nucleotide-binding universal stress UspA family protein
MKIMLATDGSSHAQVAVDVLKRLPFPPRSELTVLTVVKKVEPVAAIGAVVDDESREALGQLHSAPRQEAERMLAREAERFGKTGWSVHTVTRDGHVVQQIVEAAGHSGADLVVVGSRGLSGAKRFLPGSVSQKIMKYAPCSVLITKLKGEDDTEAGDVAAARCAEAGTRCRILVAYDGSPPAQAAVEIVASLPLGEDAEVTVLTVLTLVTCYRMDILQRLGAVWREEKRAAQVGLGTTARVLRRATPHVAMQLREGADPSHEILDAAREIDADLIVMSHKGKNRINQFLLGSVASRVVHYAPCSVWLVKV